MEATQSAPQQAPQAGQAPQQTPQPTQTQAPSQEAPKKGFGLEDVIGIAMEGMAGQSSKSRKTKSPAEKIATQAINTATREVTKGIMRGIFGNMK